MSPSSPSPNRLGFAEHSLETAGGARLFVQVSEVAAALRAEVVLTHGLGEHSGRYRHVAEVLAAKGLRLWSYDLRGHGRSAGRRGDAADYGELLEDLARVHALARAGAEGRPVFLMGHSLGGQITLSYLLRRGEDCRGAVVCAPWLRLAFAPSRWRVALARMAARWWPTYTQPTPVSWERLSRDREHLASLADPELVHHHLSARLFFAIEQAGAVALRNAPRLHTPILLLHGGADAVTSLEATREFHERVGAADKTFAFYPDARHETHNDLCRDQVLRDVTGWIEARL